MKNEFGWELVSKVRTIILNIGVCIDTYKVNCIDNEDIKKFKQQESPYQGYLLYCLRREDKQDGTINITAVYQEIKAGETVNTKSMFSEFR